MRPYYDEDGITIYHADCREILPLIQADVLITDPPYGVGLKAKRARNKGGGSHEVGRASVLYEDTPDQTRELLAEAIPLALAATSRALIFSGFAMLHTYPPPVVVGAVYLPAGSGYTPWGFQTSQPILYYGADPFLADGKGNRPNGFIHYGGGADPVDHPCPKPLSWMGCRALQSPRRNDLGPICRIGHDAPSSQGARSARHRHRDRGTLLRDRCQAARPGRLRPGRGVSTSICAVTLEPTDDYPHGVWLCKRCGTIYPIPPIPAPACTHSDTPPAASDEVHFDRTAGGRGRNDE